MPTIFNENGFRGMVRTDDHEPAHIHVIKDKIEFRINAKTLELIGVKGDYKAKDLKIAIALTQKHQADILAKWEEIHG